MGVLARLVMIRSEGHIQSEVVPGRIFKAFEQPTRNGSVQVQPLIPRHLAGIAHVPQTKLGVLLVAATLLALTAGIDVVLEPAIAATVQVIMKSVATKTATIAEDT